jgi:hypothetical protein
MPVLDPITSPEGLAIANAAIVLALLDALTAGGALSESEIGGILNKARMGVSARSECPAGSMLPTSLIISPGTSPRSKSRHRAPGGRRKPGLHSPGGQRDADAVQSAADAVRQIPLGGVIHQITIRDSDNKAHDQQTDQKA